MVAEPMVIESAHPVFFADPLPVMGPAVLDGSEGHHAARVRRMRAGERLRLTDGRGGVAQCQVTAVDGASLELHVSTVEQYDPACPRLVVVQALPKGDRGELAVELMTELGVDEIVPWCAARCVTQWRAERGEKALMRWRSIAHGAAKQARRLWWPHISPLASTSDVAKTLSAVDTALVLHESATTRLATVDIPSRVPATGGTIALVVGPEGGITDDELATFSSAGAMPVLLGPTVLRTSTAGAAGLAVVSALTQRWGR